MEENIKGGMWGLLIGDAFGVPYEFKSKNQLPKQIPVSMKTPEGFVKTYRKVKFGTWSDDGAQALCLAESLLKNNKLNIEDLGKKLVQWYKHGHMAVDCHVFDCGITTEKALTKIADGISARFSGSYSSENNGNGSLMRVLPLALWHRGTDRELLLDAQAQSIVTHGHIISQICCAIYCLWARKILEGKKDPWEEAFFILKNHYNEDELINNILDSINNYKPEGTGYVVDCLVSSKKASEAGSFAEAIIEAVKFGNDTDTTAAVTGGIVGLRDGFNSIPQNLFAELRGKEIAESIIEKLCQI